MLLVSHLLARLVYHMGQRQGQERMVYDDERELTKAQRCALFVDSLHKARSRGVSFKEMRREFGCGYWGVWTIKVAVERVVAIVKHPTTKRWVLLQYYEED